MADAPYKIVVGLEVHVQLKTKTKLFCGCSTTFGSPPNTQVCPVCLGMPGVLPVMNRTAFELAMRAALALNCTIAGFTKWDRKNYYYPDLPKNFQISQYDLPFSENGFVEINVAADPKKDYVPKKIRLIRAHLEEDAGKNTHDESGRGGDSKVDLNRTGIPLLEIVSQPDINNPEEARAYLTELRLMLREIGVSNCEMQEGSMRCDANVNLHIPKADGSYDATPLVEVKNLNSISAVGRAIAYEAERQYEEYQQDPSNYLFAKVPKTTAGWNDARQKTEVQRSKESAADYRYFPEPDLVPVIPDEAMLQAAKESMGELPSTQRTRLQQAPYSLSHYDAMVLSSKGRAMVNYFEEVTKIVGNAKESCNRIGDFVLSKLNENNWEIEQFPIASQGFGDFVQKTSSLAKDARLKLFEFMLENNVDAGTAMDKTGIKPMTDETVLREAVLAAIAANPKAVDDYKKGKVAAANSIKGYVMKNNKGAPNDVVQRLLEEELKK